MNNIMELIFIIDCSKAMTGCEFETVASVNTILERYRDTEGTVYVHIFSFNDVLSTICDRQKIREVIPLTISDMKTGGNSALYDSVAMVIRHIRIIHHYIRPEDVPQKTLFYIYSGGLDNSSVKYYRTDMRNMIENRVHKDHWQFFFEKENIYTAKRDILFKQEPDNDGILSDDDFSELMRILGKGKINW